jgi:hypothetical protein
VLAFRKIPEKDIEQKNPMKSLPKPSHEHNHADAETQTVLEGAEAVDNLLNALVADQVWKTEDQARNAGQSSAEIEQTLLAESWRMLVLLIRTHYDSLWPESESWVLVISHLLQCSESEGLGLSEQLIQAGWLDGDFQATGLGLWQVGLAHEG